MRFVVQQQRLSELTFLWFNCQFVMMCPCLQAGRERGAKNTKRGRLRYVIRATGEPNCFCRDYGLKNFLTEALRVLVIFSWKSLLLSRRSSSLLVI
jgi:hypothetical protein